MDEKRIENQTDELTDEALNAVNGGARGLIAGAETPSRPAGPADRETPKDPLKPRMIY